MKQIWLFIVGLSLSLLLIGGNQTNACEPCDSSLAIQETVQQADLIIIGQKIRNLIEPGIPPEISPETLIRVDQTLKGFVKEKELKVHSFSGDCPYGIVVDDKNYLMLLKGPPYTAVNNGCAVKTLPVQGGLIELEGRRLSVSEFAAQFGLSVAEKPKPDLMFLLDLSAGMFEESEGEKRVECAKQALQNAVAKLPPDQEVALRVFGRREPPGILDESGNQCQDSELLIPFAANQKEKILEVVKGLEAKGVASLSYSIVQTELDYASRKDRLHKLIIISYGEDSCGHDPVLAARDVANHGFALEVSVIGLDATEAVQQKLQGIAKEFEGTFTNIKSCRDLEPALEASAAAGGIGKPPPPEEDGVASNLGAGNGGVMKAGCSRNPGGDPSPSEKKACGVGILLLLILLAIWAIWRYWRKKRREPPLYRP